MYSLAHACPDFLFLPLLFVEAVDLFQHGATDLVAFLQNAVERRIVAAQPAIAGHRAYLVLAACLDDRVVPRLKHQQWNLNPARFLSELADRVEALLDPAV